MNSQAAREASAVWRKKWELTELIETESPAKRDLYSGFGNALSLGFEFVATVGLLYLLGYWIGGTIGGAIGIVLGWIGAILRLYVRFQPEPLVVRRAGSGR